MRVVFAAGIAVLLGLIPPGDVKQFTDWSSAENLGAPINSVYIDSCAAISKNGLSLYFSSIRQNPSVQLDRDLYVSTRASLDDPWGTPIPLTVLNSNVWDSCPALSLDEHRLYFTTRRSPTCGNSGLEDIWVSHRRDRSDDLGWEPPVSLGCDSEGYVNSSARDLAPTFFEDNDGNEVMYFGSTRTGVAHHYQSVMRPDDTFGPASPLPALNSASTDLGITVRRDGLEVFFLSNRPGGSGASGSMDFWKSTRDNLDAPWSPPVFVPSLGNPAWAQGRITLSFDGRELYFASSRSGDFDLWVAKREWVRGSKK